MKFSQIFLPLALIGALALLAAPRANANLIQNGGFEDGTYTSTVDGYTNPNVPVGWTANAAFDMDSGYNQVRTYGYLSSSNLSIGNFDWDPNPVLSQTFSDTPGQVYIASLYLESDSWDSGSFFEASVGDANFLDPISTGYPIDGYTLESFTFVGTGSDALELTGNDSPGEWYVDDVDVSAVPDRGATLLMLGLGLAALGWFRRHSFAGSIS
jgi:hypothetical protein